MESSRCFVANIGAVDARTEELLKEWATTNCADFMLSRNADGHLLLHAKRAAKNPKSHKLTLRNVGTVFKCNVGRLDEFSLLTDGEFDRAKVDRSQDDSERLNRVEADEATLLHAEQLSHAGADVASIIAPVTEANDKSNRATAVDIQIVRCLPSMFDRLADEKYLRLLAERAIPVA